MFKSFSFKSRAFAEEKRQSLLNGLQSRKSFGKNARAAQLQQQFIEADTDGSGELSLEEVAAHLVAACGTKDPDAVELLEQAAQLWFDEMVISIRDKDSISREEWIHSMMLKATAPSHIAAECLNQRLRPRVAAKPTFLANAQAAFMAADKNGDGSLSRNEWPAALKGLKVGVDESSLDYNGDGVIDYFEFSSLMVGTKPEVVELAMYDISGGKGKYIPRFLTSGHKFEGIWHTGVLAFGKEYWYGGGVFQSVPGKTPFGEPLRIVQLGKTLRTQKELMRYLSDELRWEYTYATYDVFTHNCNCFSNDVTKFLMDNAQIPEEVRMQPKWAEGGVAVKLLRPILNKALGQFGSEAGASCVHSIDDLTEEWRKRLDIGDLVLHRKRFMDSPNVARVMEVYGEDLRPSVDLEMFVLQENAKVKVDSKQLSKIPLQELFPLRRIRGGQMRGKLAIGDASQDSEAARVLRRRATTSLEPLRCTRGHVMTPGPRVLPLVGKRPTCSVCHQEGTAGNPAQCCSQRCSGEGLQCVKCNFVMCAKCADDGIKIGAFSDILSCDLAAKLLDKPHLLKYKAFCYYDRADYNWSDDLDEGELSSLLERISWELEMKFSVANKLRNDQLVSRHAFVQLFTDILKKSADKASRK
mmetsp:Transcript_108952/g.210896  ORF Transcript_108952/g.210896 Transcript_108952/m.210896 type:complete len:640 (+) Transcript_108952:66-1985(+)